MEDYTSLHISRNLLYSWIYIPNGETYGFGLSKGYFSFDENDGKLQIVEEGRAKRPKVHISNVTFKDDYLGTPGISFSSLSSLQNLLIQKGCPLAVNLISNSGLNELPIYNKFNQVTGFSVVDNLLTMNANWIWVINNNLNSNASQVDITIPLPPIDKHRIDLVLANNNNSFELLTGEEVDLTETPIAEPIPIGYLKATFLLVSNVSIEVGPDPNAGDIYIEKEEFVQKSINTGGTISLILDSIETNFIVNTNELTIIEDTQPTTQYLAEFLRDDKLISIFNNSEFDTIIKHSIDENCFRLPSEVNLTIPPKHLARFRQSKTNTLHYQFDSLSLDTQNQNNFVRVITIGSSSLSGVGTIEEQICEYILALPEAERTILETDSKTNILITETVAPPPSVYTTQYNSKYL